MIPFEPMREQLKRIIKPNGAIVLFGSEPFSSALRMSNIKQYKYDWIYKKRPVNFLNAKKQPMRNVENISVFWWKNYYPQWLVYNPKINKRSNSTETNWKHWDSNLSEYSNYPNQILEFTQERWLHPTQKPVALIEYLIRTYTNEWETVLDFTMWSWSTWVWCQNTKRNYIWFELDRWYYEIANKRLEENKKRLDILDFTSNI